jgi:hypothetical protein
MGGAEGSLAVFFTRLGIFTVDERTARAFARLLLDVRTVYARRWPKHFVYLILDAIELMAGIRAP